MSEAVNPGDLSPQRLEATANGAERHPPLKLKLTQEQGLRLALQNTCIGALENAASALALFGAAEEAEYMRGLSRSLNERGRAIIDAAAKPPLIVVPEMELPRAP